MEGFVPVRLAYNTFEPTAGVNAALSPVIFLHGGLMSKDHWLDIPQTVANETGRKAYALDARNHGASEWSDIFNFDINADDLLHFMDSHDIPKAVVIGHSMGGVAGIKAALKNPSKVEQLIVEDMYVKKIPNEILESVAVYTTMGPKSLEKLPDDVTEEEAKAFVMKYIHDQLPSEIRSMKTNDSEDAHFYLLKKTPDGRFTFKSNLAAFDKICKSPETAMSDPEGLYDGPAYFIYGQLSNFHVNEEESHIKKFFPNAEFVCIEGASHNVHIDRPAEFMAAVLKCIPKK